MARFVAFAASIARAAVTSAALMSAAHAEPNAVNALGVQTITATYPRHCLSADQRLDPRRDAPIAAFDGDDATAWSLCPAAEQTSGYSIDVTLTRALITDGLRVVFAPPALPAGKGKAAMTTEALRGRVTHLEVALYDTSLSTTTPVITRVLEPADGRPAREVTLAPPLKWNPKLIEDEAFGQARVARGLSDFLPAPLRVDRISLIVRGVEPAELPAQVAEVGFKWNGALVPVTGVAEAQTRHTAFIEKGLKHILEDRWVVSDERAVHFEPTGTLWSVERADFDAGLASKNRKRLGAWAINAGRLMVGASKAAPQPVGYFLDDAPRRVVLAGLLAGEYRVVSTAPEPSAPPDAPMSNAPTSAEPPLLLE